jgi:phospholipid/cholesterol/gamma-HCH transport system permease protein
MDDEVDVSGGAVEDPTAPAWHVTIDHPDGGVLRLRLSGRWTLDARPPAAADVLAQTMAASDTRLAVDSDPRLRWDSGMLIFLRAVLAEADRRQMAVDLVGLPEGAQRLLALASATPEHKEMRSGDAGPSLLGRIGASAITAARSAVDGLAFIGEACIGVHRLLAGKARFQRSELLLVAQEVGAHALPIVSLITFLVGVILAYVGAVQLRAFGAQVYVADLVSVAVTREMGAMMTAIVMAGRTGAAFAAQLGTMQVNEEINALRTSGIPPMEFLVLPRMIALAVMMPLLYLYADLLGMLGGAVVGVGLLHLGGLEYYQRSVEAIGLNDVAAGLIKASVFGGLVAIAGCLRGMQSGRTAAAVAAAATSAVVTGIVLIIVSDAVMTVLFDLLHL